MAIVIFNPKAGKSRAAGRLPEWLTDASSAIELRPTDGPGHAVELARAAALEGHDIVAAAGGDGTVHEVANGLLMSGREDVTLAVVPIGSANDFAYSLEEQFGTSQIGDGKFNSIDVGEVSSSKGQHFFVESIGLGLSAQVTLESRRIHWLQGQMLYGLAALRGLAKYRRQTLSIAWDDEPPAEQVTMLLSLMLGQREGNFLLAPKAVMDDGLFDVVHARELSRWGAVCMMPALAKSGPPENHPQVTLRRCHSMSVRSPVPLTIHTDGEMFCTPTDELTDVSIRLLPRRLRAKVCLP